MKAQFISYPAVSSVSGLLDYLPEGKVRFAALMDIFFPTTRPHRQRRLISRLNVYQTATGHTRISAG